MSPIEQFKAELSRHARQPAQQETDKSKPAVFGRLKIEQRVLETPQSTIAIRNISQLASYRSWTDEWSLPSLPKLIARIAAAIGLSAFAMGALFTAPLMAAFGVIGLFVALIFAVFGRQRTTKWTHHLKITTNGGTQSLFSSDSESVVEQVRRILTEKNQQR